MALEIPLRPAHRYLAEFAQVSLAVLAERDGSVSDVPGGSVNILAHPPYHAHSEL